MSDSIKSSGSLEGIEIGEDTTTIQADNVTRIQADASVKPSAVDTSPTAEHALVPMSDDIKPISIDAFKEIKDGAIVSPAKETPTDEPKKEDTTVQQQTNVQAKKVNARDYSDLPQDVVPLFERMSNDAFSKMKPMFLEHGKIKEQLAAKDAEIVKIKETASIPKSVYDHDDAFVLDPEFQTLSTQINNQESLLNYWQTQLQNVREGKPWSRLALNADKTAYVLTDPQPATVQDEAQIIAQLTAVNTQLLGARNQVQGFQQQYKQRIEADKQFVGETMAKYFPGYQDKTAPIHKVVDQTLNAIPKSFRNHPLAQALAMSITANMQQKLIIDSLVKEAEKTPATTNATTKKDIKAAGPTEAAINGGGDSRPAVSIADFQALKY